MHDPLRGPAAAARRGEPFLPRRERFSSGIDEFAEVRWRVQNLRSHASAWHTTVGKALRCGCHLSKERAESEAATLWRPRCQGRHAGDALRSPGVAGSAVGNIRLEACMHVLAPADKPADAARERRGF